MRGSWRVRGLVAMTMAAVMVPSTAGASHSWGGYHWARAANPFTLSLGDNVSSAWDGYLATTSSDWSASAVLDTKVVSGSTSARRCRPKSGRVEVCNGAYGTNGWLGVAQIWVSGLHITQGTVKVNDTYFSSATYNTPGWRNLVMCQEVGHTLGLDHQDENFGNTNLGTCMDYTSNPYGPPDNEHPNQHDYDELVTIYSHVDSFTTVSSSTSSARARGDFETPGGWGHRIAGSDDAHSVAVHQRDLGADEQLITFVIWAA